MVKRKVRFSEEVLAFDFMASDLGTSFTSQQHPCSSAEGTIPPLQQHETSSSTHTIIEKPSCAKLNVIKKRIVAILRSLTAGFKLDRITLSFSYSMQKSP
jgi:hypothetical protein